MTYRQNPEYKKQIKKLAEQLDKKQISFSEYRRHAENLMKKHG